VANSVMWFRRDLRLSDNEALCAAAAQGSVTPLFVIDPTFFEKSGNARIAFFVAQLTHLECRHGRFVGGA
jgi:deoxyribodipyrimidine photo-lyase